MTVTILKFKKLHEDAIIPSQATPYAAGLDLCALDPVSIPAYEVRLVNTGLALELPIGFEGQIRPRSGMALKHSISVINTPGTIDADYRGEIKVALINHSSKPFAIEAGMRIAQLVIAKLPSIKIEEVTTLSDTDRGQGGFGSTGA